MRYARKIWPAMAALLIVLAGCGVGGAASGAVSTPATRQPDWVTPTCPTPGQSLHTGGGVPTDFRVTWVLRCGTETRNLPGHGRWTVQVAERADTPATNLLAQLRQPSTAGRTGECAAQSVSIAYFALVDATGRALVPTVPTGTCGQPLPGVATALAALPFRTIAVDPLNQLQSQAALDAGCAQTWKDLTPGTTSTQAGTLWPAPPPSLRICVYGQVSGGAVRVGQFLAGHTVAGATENALLTALAQAGPAAPCTTAHTRFAVLFGTGDTWLVAELDGCRRLLTPGGVAGQLQSSTVDQITGG